MTALLPIFHLGNAKERLMNLVAVRTGSSGSIKLQILSQKNVRLSVTFIIIFKKLGEKKHKVI